MEHGSFDVTMDWKNYESDGLGGCDGPPEVYTCKFCGWSFEDYPWGSRTPDMDDKPYRLMSQHWNECAKNTLGLLRELRDLLKENKTKEIGDGERDS